jgi:CRISPR-associated protein Cmr2
LNNLIEAIDKLKYNGIGAKTKLGWGSFEIENKKVCVNSDLEVPEGWK